MLRRLSSSTDTPTIPRSSSGSWMFLVVFGGCNGQQRGLMYSPYAGLRKRPSQSPAMRKKDEQIIFPKTLKSGRYEQKDTIAQKNFRGSSEASQSAPDTRFFRKAQDYREIQDGDPYAKLFGESKTTAKVRLNHWQRQFEEENADVELPYERTNILARSAPNWFVRMFINIRDAGGMDHMYHAIAFGVFVVSLMCLASYLLYTTPNKAKPTQEIR